MSLLLKYSFCSVEFPSKFYRNLNKDVKKQIAKTHYNAPYLYLESWLQTLSNIRNIYYSKIINQY
ncbi:Abi family protein [Niallia sp. NCCP-28]|uniref:Abi family protein n=1 Tax=Niallia sp. NCCP-28 TaxID=2934712 RepID=UPI0035D0CC7F